MGYDKKRGFTDLYHKRLKTLIQTRLDNPDNYAGDSGAARAKRDEAEWEFVVNGGGVGETEDEYNPPPRWEPWTAPGAHGTGAAAAGASALLGGDYASVPPPGVGAPALGEAPPGYF
jgi:hypothetical protein